MIYHRWAYFLNIQELVTLFKECGGGIGNFDPKHPDDMHHARRAIFLYLQPGRVEVWFATLDDQNGVVLFVGKSVPNIRESVDRGLARRCKDMFERSPDPCRVVRNSLSLQWDLYARDGSVHRLHLIEFLQSDREGDRYPLTEEELALFPSQRRKATSAVQPLVDSCAPVRPTRFHRWVYFLNTQELVNLSKECGGGIGNFNPEDPRDMDHARRAIFLYLQPGRVEVWFATLGQQVGVVFFVGKPVPDIRESVDRGLARRCKDMFERSPDPCRVVVGTLSLQWCLFARDGSVHRLHLMELLQSDRKGDIYPLTEEELALFPSRRAASSSSSAS